MKFELPGLPSRLVALLALLVSACGIADIDSSPTEPLPVVSLKSLVLEGAKAKTLRGACTLASPTLMRCDGPLVLDRPRGLSISGEGMTIEFQSPQAGRGGIFVYRAANVHIGNFRITWTGSILSEQTAGNAPGDPIYSIARVLPCENGAALQLPAPLSASLPIATIAAWDVQTGWSSGSADGEPLDYYYESGKRLDFVDGISACQPDLAPLREGHAVIRHHLMTNHAFHCVECSNVIVKNVTIDSSPGMGFVFDGGSNIELSSNVVAPACAPDCRVAMPSLAADAAHFTEVTGRVVVDSNDFSFQGDDGINVSSALLPARLRRVAGQTRWAAVPEPGYGWRSDFFPGGATVRAYSPALALLASGRATGKRASDDAVLLDMNTQAGLALLAVEHAATDRVVIRNNRIHDNRARGILLTMSNALVQSNRIERTSMNAILLAADTAVFYEGPGVTDAKIIDNRIVDTNRSPTHPLLASPISVGAITPDQRQRVPTFQRICIARNAVRQLPTDRAPPVTNPYRCAS